MLALNLFNLDITMHRIAAKKEFIANIGNMQYINIGFILYITCSIQKRAFISLHISTVGVVRLYFKCIVKFDQTTFYFWTVSNTMHHKLCSLCKRHLLFQRQQEIVACTVKDLL